MNTTILLPIHPEFATLIIAGKKKYEYRKIIPRETISYIALYSTCPVQKIVAIVEVVDKISDTPTKLWKRTAKDGAITRKHFRQYFYGKKTASAFKLGKVIAFDKPIALEELSVTNSPQSFLYLSLYQIEVIFAKLN